MVIRLKKCVCSHSPINLVCRFHLNIVILLLLTSFVCVLVAVCLREGGREGGRKGGKKEGCLGTAELQASMCVLKRANNNTYYYSHQTRE